MFNRFKSITTKGVNVDSTVRQKKQVFSEFKIIVFLHIFDDKNHIVDIYLNLEGLINRCYSIVFHQ